MRGPLCDAFQSCVAINQVLGVSPDADMKTIKKVFREQAIELHPDKASIMDKNDVIYG